MWRAMRVSKIKARSGEAESKPQAADPRLVALARLLARHAARENHEKQLSASPGEAYRSDSLPKDAP
jgi:hypothetical protein